MARATAPTLPSFFGSTNTTRTPGTSGRYIQREIFLGMRIALKIAYDGRAFFGYQRQPDRRTVEGECIAALRSAKIIRDTKEAFFRSASRTDRGVTAVGNVIAFNTSLSAGAAIGAFNDRVRNVWGGGATEGADTFHPPDGLGRGDR